MAPLKFINVVTGHNWEATEVLPPAACEAPVVDADEDILQMLAAGARAIRNEEESLEDQDEDIELNRWGNPMNGWANRSTSTLSTKKHDEIQWLHGETDGKYVHQEGSNHRCYMWR